MSRKKQQERWKIIYTPWRYTYAFRYFDIPNVYIFRWQVVERIGPPMREQASASVAINDYIAHAGFNTEAEAKAYRRMKVQEERHGQES